LWLKDVAPSTELRKWFNHDPAKWKQFQARYRKELSEAKDAVTLLAEKSKNQTVTLLAEVEKRLAAHGAAKKLVPPKTVLLDTAKEALSEKLRETVTDLIAEEVDIDGMVDEALGKVKPPSIADIPAAMQKWAAKLKPESWHKAEADMIQQKIDAIRDRIGEIVEGVV